GTAIELTYALDDTMPRLVVGDAARLRQGLVNLFANAIKFTPAGGGGVTLSARRRAGLRRESYFAGGGHRGRHPKGSVRPSIQGFQPGGCLDDAPIWRDRLGAGHQQATERTHGRADLGGERAGERLDVPLYDRRR